MKPSEPLHATERQGDSVKGGGRPGDKPVREADEIEEMTGHAVGGHGKVPGIDDRGVPGSDPDPEHAGSESKDPTGPRIGPDAPRVERE